MDVIAPTFSLQSLLEDRKSLFYGVSFLVIGAVAYLLFLVDVNTYTRIDVMVRKNMEKRVIQEAIRKDKEYLQEFSVRADAGRGTTWLVAALTEMASKGSIALESVGPEKDGGRVGGGVDNILIKAHAQGVAEYGDLTKFLYAIESNAKYIDIVSLEFVADYIPSPRQAVSRNERALKFDLTAACINAT